MAPPPFLSSPEQYKELFDSVDTFLLDCDGVIWHGPQPTPGAKDVLQMMREAGKRIIFVTNNATKSRAMYKKTFDKLGIEASESEIFGSAYASAVYLSKVLKFPKDKKVFVLGERGLEDELDSVGVAHCGGTDPEYRVFLPSMDFSAYKRDPTIGAVLCGFDSGICYKKLSTAFINLRDDPSVAFVLTNQDRVFPAPGAQLFPGSGALSSPLVFALQGIREPPVIVGKPSTLMMDAIVAEHEFDRSRALMVGDNLLTDIAFGNNSGVRTLLVKGGVTSDEVIAKLGTAESSESLPTFVMESFGDFAVLAENKN